MKHQDKLKDHSFDTLFYNSLGIDHLNLALVKTTKLQLIDFSENDIGPENFKILLPIFDTNTQVTFLNIADCRIDGNCCVALCELLQKNQKLKSLFFRNSKI